ncbi:MAG TPA: hypothetical protein QGH03_01140 [Candidatus Paceibacterota bacterium]|jgi:hypothetical protein|nr:hypothetical protein [Candidatus Paceibacterota bacterium]HJN62821.1 hypothetical protein [Candidatus Paceibacterota bacterium]|tara:strand:- start:195 stop:371 length:177 start_codon:yes stop_codon:yes gene_type:complete
MSRKKVEERNIRKLVRSGGGRSVSVNIPVEFVRKLKWRGKQKVVLKRKGSMIVIKDWK